MLTDHTHNGSANIWVQSIAFETSYTQIATLSCDQVCSEFQ